MVKNPPANAGDIRDVSSIPGSERSLEKEMATCSGILAWRLPQRSLEGYSLWGRSELAMTGVTLAHIGALWYLFLQGH